MGRGEGRHPLHPLVPAHDRRHRREARQLHRPRRRRQDHDGVLRQGAGPGRARRLLLPLRRSAGHLRGPGLHRLGPHLLRLHQGGLPVHPHHLLLLLRRGSGQKDPAAAVHGGGQPPGGPHPAAVRRHGDQAGGGSGGPGAGVLPDRQGPVRQAGGSADVRPDPVRRQAPQGPGAGGPLLRRHPSPGGRLYEGSGRGAVEAGRAQQDQAQ